MNEFNFPIRKGETFRMSAVVLQPDEVTPFDLTGWTGRMQLREEIDCDDVILELNTTNGGLTLGGTAGTVAFFISSDDTSDILQERGFYDCELTGPGLNPDTMQILSGRLRFIAEVTR